MCAPLPLTRGLWQSHPQRQDDHSPADSAETALAEVGVDITGNSPTLIDPQLVRDVDVVVTLGRAGRVHPVPGTRFEDWDTDERSERGIDGTERMRLVRDDTADRVAEFLKRMQTRSS